MTDTPVKDNRGGARPGAGRPLGSKNKVMPLVKKLSREMTDKAMHELFRIAGLLETEKKNPDGSLALDKDGKAIIVPVPGSPSDNARIAAINIILERGWGKAMQPVVGVDDETGEAGGPVRVTKVEHEVVPVGTPFAMNENGEYEMPDDEEKVA